MIVIELSIVSLLLVLLLIKCLITFLVGTYQTRVRSELTACLMHAIEYGIVSDAIREYPRCRRKSLLLHVLEDFDKKLQGDEWSALKIELTLKFLLPTARQLVHHSKWIRRSFAVRCFALATEDQDIPLLLELLDDPMVLVANRAALALIRAESYIGVENVILRMSISSGYRRCFYRDLLLEGSVKVFAWIIRIAIVDKDPRIHLATLEVLSHRVIVDSLPFLQEDLQSLNADIRKMAVTICAINPHHATSELLLQHVSDREQEIRLKAIAGLRHFREEKVFTTLKTLLKEPEWNIRLEAVRALKSMGPQGVDLLRGFTVNGDKESCALVQYALQFD